MYRASEGGGFNFGTSMIRPKPRTLSPKVERAALPSEPQKQTPPEEPVNDEPYKWPMYEPLPQPHLDFYDRPADIRPVVATKPVKVATPIRQPTRLFVVRHAPQVPCKHCETGPKLLN